MIFNLYYFTSYKCKAHTSYREIICNIFENIVHSSRIIRGYLKKYKTKYQQICICSKCVKIKASFDRGFSGMTVAVSDNTTQYYYWFDIPGGISKKLKCRHQNYHMNRTNNDSASISGASRIQSLFYDYWRQPLQMLDDIVNNAEESNHD